MMFDIDIDADVDLLWFSFLVFRIRDMSR